MRAAGPPAGKRMRREAEPMMPMPMAANGRSGGGGKRSDIVSLLLA